MSPETATWLLYAITAVGAAVWVVGLQFLIATSRAAKAADSAVDRFGPIKPRSGDVISGTSEVEGLPDELAGRPC